MKKNIWLYVIALVILLFISFGASYAWFSVSKESQVITTSSGKLSVKYTKGDEISGNLYPTTNYLKGLNTTIYFGLNDTSLKAIGTLSLKIKTLPEALRIAGLKWELRDSESSALLANGDFSSYNDTTKNNIILKDDITLEYEQKGYSLYIWLDGNTTGNEVKDLSFEGSLVASAVQTNYVS